jgi:hypothetical protein
MYTGSIAIDFDVFKAITARRDRADVSENDVLRELFGLPSTAAQPEAKAQKRHATDLVWRSEGANFMVGSKLQHRFRNGQIASAMIVANGVEYEGIVYPGLSPAAAAAAGHQANGWQFWEINTLFGWKKADTLRHS